MPLVQQLFQLLDPTRQLRAALRVEQPTHLPELLLRVPNVQGQDRSGEEPAKPLFQADLAVDDDLHRLVGLGGKAASRRLGPSPLHRRPPRAERPEYLLVARAMKPTVLLSPQGVHHHQRRAAAVLALVPLLPPTLPTPPLPLGTAAMPLTSTAPFAPRPRLSPPRQLLIGGGGDRLAVDLDDQHVAVALGQGAVAEEDVGRPAQAQDPLLDRRGRRRGPQEHLPEPAGDPEAHPGGQPTEPADDQRAGAIAGQTERDVQ